VTLTTGKVSAIKTANGDSRNLIETDTTIGHGNSGGPVFDGNGNVIGIATYTIDGGGQGAGTFNYVRDIQDLKDLASASGIHFATTSSTQLAWQKAITAFDSAHYSKSLKYFAQAKTLYPVHPTVASFVSRAEHNVSAGKDVKDFPLGLIIGGAVTALAVAAGAIVVIVRHHAKHQVFKLASGQVAAMEASPQQGSAGGYYYPVLPQLAPDPDVGEVPLSTTAGQSAHSLHR
jgi:serine protease Do